MPFIQQVKLMRHPEREAAETEDAEDEDVAAAKKANEESETDDEPEAA